MPIGDTHIERNSFRLVRCRSVRAGREVGGHACVVKTRMVDVQPLLVRAFVRASLISRTDSRLDNIVCIRIYIGYRGLELEVGVGEVGYCNLIDGIRLQLEYEEVDKVGLCGEVSLDEDTACSMRKPEPVGTLVVVSAHNITIDQV
jgi:hypothetical protein